MLTLKMVEMDILLKNVLNYLVLKIEMQMFLRQVFVVMQVMLYMLRSAAAKRPLPQRRVARSGEDGAPAGRAARGRPRQRPFR